ISATASVAGAQAGLDLAVPDPQRWWPNGMGEPALYEFSLSLVEEDDVVDRAEARVGLRTIELAREADDIGEGFVFRVNGRPLFAKGGNWIPDDLFPARTTPDRLRQVLDLAREC